MKKEHIHASDHLGDIKLGFLAALVSGIDNKLTSPKGTIMYSRLGNKKKNDQFKNHILDMFAQRAESALEHIEHDGVLAHAQKMQKKYLAAASKHVNKVDENFSHHDLVQNTFAEFNKVHQQLLNKI